MRTATSIALGVLVVAAFSSSIVRDRPASASPPPPPCSPDARLVEHEYFDKLEHSCIDARGKACFAYEPGEIHIEGASHLVRVCVDIYEAPNRRGARPIVMKNGIEAETYCTAHGKRLCTEEEWESACEGPEKLPYTYGWKSDLEICNSGKPWRAFDAEALRAGGERAQSEVERLWQGEPSGSRARCVSKEGVQDLLGNVEEWVVARQGRPFSKALKGGFWSKPWTSCRGTNDAHDERFRFYEIGFRCCADPHA